MTSPGHFQFFNPKPGNNKKKKSIDQKTLGDRMNRRHLKHEPIEKQTQNLS